MPLAAAESQWCLRGPGTRKTGQKKMPYNSTWVCTGLVAEVEIITSILGSIRPHGQRLLRLTISRIFSQGFLRCLLILRRKDFGIEYLLLHS